jgi:hypothetical protein
LGVKGSIVGVSAIPAALFKRASAEVRRSALKEFRNSPIGKVSKEIDGVLRLHRRTGKSIDKLFGNFEKAKKTRLGPALANMGIKELDRYAKQTVKSGVTDPIMSAFFDALGPFGKVLQQVTGGDGLQQSLDAASGLLRAFGYETLSPPGSKGRKGELDRMADALRQAGYNVEAPGQKASEAAGRMAITPGSEPGAKGRRQRKTVDVSIGGKNKRIRKDDPMFTGEMVDVSSSNVHSVGYDAKSDQLGTLKVRFLQNNKPGPLYHYYSVPAEIFQTLRKSGHPGKVVWSKLRIEGTVSGHQYDYRLKGIVAGYVPRKAVFLGGEARQEGFKPRGFASHDGQTFRSRLPMEVLRGLPNRAAPNTGAP